jgi:hypothetical protein
METKLVVLGEDQVVKIRKRRGHDRGGGSALYTTLRQYTNQDKVCIDRNYGNDRDTGN